MSTSRSSATTFQAPAGPSSSAGTASSGSRSGSGFGLRGLEGGLALELELALAGRELAGLTGERSLTLGHRSYAFPERRPAFRDRLLAIVDGLRPLVQRGLAFREGTFALRDGSRTLGEHRLALQERILRRRRWRPPPGCSGHERGDCQAEQERAEQGDGQNRDRSRPDDAIARDRVPCNANRRVALAEKGSERGQPGDERGRGWHVALRRRNVSKLLAQLGDRAVQLSLERSGTFGDELVGDGVRDLRGSLRIVGLGAHDDDVRLVVRAHGHRVEHVVAIEPQLHGGRVDDGRPFDEVGDRLSGAPTAGNAREPEPLERRVARGTRDDEQLGLPRIAVLREQEIGAAGGKAEQDGGDDRLPVGENAHLLVTSSIRGVPVLRAVFRTCPGSLDVSWSLEEPASSART